MAGYKARIAALVGWRRWAAAALLGALATLALPPLHVLPLLVVAFVGLVWLIDAAATRRAAFAAGWWFGVGHFSSGLYWFAHAMLVEPERFAALIPFAVLGAGALLGVAPGFAALAARLCRPGVARILGLAAAWVVAELLRGRLFTGFPWNLIGYSWTVSDEMIQFAALAGSTGLGLVTVLAAALPATLADGGGARRWAGTIAATALVAALWAGGALRLADAETAMVEGVGLRLVQPAIAQRDKWRPELRDGHFTRYLRMTADDRDASVSHVIWPETAITYPLADDPVRRQLIAAVTPPDGLVLSGAVRVLRPTDGAPEAWNSIYAIDAKGAILETYDKFHLVPFGEYLPLRDVLAAVGLTFGNIDFSRGPGPRTIRLPGLPPVGPLICFEVVFPHQVVDPDDRPEWLLNVTNDAWFGYSLGPFQHFASARMRAVEQGLPLVRVANTGISAVIDAHGRVRARLGLDTRGVIDSGLPVALAAATPYGRFGDAIPLALAALLGALSALWSVRAALVRGGKSGPGR